MTMLSSPNSNPDPKPEQVAAVSQPPMAPMGELEIRPYVIINSDGSEGEPKLTLEAACTAAQDGQIVEIHHDGLLPDVLNKPIRIKNKSLTIRAGENHRPLLHFAGIGTPAEGLTTRLFQLSKASVDLINLDFQLAPPSGAEAGQTWAIASLEGGGRMLLQNVTVTVNAPGNHLAAVVELLPAPASQTAKDMKMMMNQDSEPARSEFQVKVQNSFIRGSCNVFISRHTLPGQINVEGSALAVEGSLLVAEGNLDMPAEGNHVELRLEHSTCLVGNSLIRMDSGDTPRDLIPVYVTNSQNNLIATNTTSALVSMTGGGETEPFSSLLRWYGRKNFYDGFDDFWSTSSPNFLPRKFERWVNGWKSADDTTKEEALSTAVSPGRAIGPAWSFPKSPPMIWPWIARCPTTAPWMEPPTVPMSGPTSPGSPNSPPAPRPNRRRKSPFASANAADLIFGEPSRVIGRVKAVFGPRKSL